MLSQSPPESICIVRLSAIGDTCHALAVVRTIQDAWPETRITWIIGKTEASLLGDIPEIEFIIFDKSRGKDAQVQIRETLASRKFDVANFEMVILGMSGLERLEKLKAERVEVEVILLTGQGTSESAVQAMKLGAYD